MEVNGGLFQPPIPYLLSLTWSLLDVTTLHIAGTVATIQPTSDINAIPTTSIQCAELVCLPYSLVPGMDINSLAFQKALSALGKQQLKVPASPKALTTHFK
jgi:hypothetical protein